MSNLGRFIAERRKALGMTQRTLATKIEATDRNYIARLEGGDIKLPGAAVRKRLATALEVRTVDLMAAAGEIEASELDTPNTARPRRVFLSLKIDELSHDHLDMLEVIINQMLQTQAAQLAQSARRGLRAPLESNGN